MIDRLLRSPCTTRNLQIERNIKKRLTIVSYPHSTGPYWVANTFIWNWLLLPIIPLSDLIKQDFGSNINTKVMLNPLWLRLVPYFIFTLLSLIIWGSTYPGWSWFITNVLQADTSTKILGPINFQCDHTVKIPIYRSAPNISLKA